MTAPELEDARPVPRRPGTITIDVTRSELVSLIYSLEDTIVEYPAQDQELVREEATLCERLDNILRAHDRGRKQP